MDYNTPVQTSYGQVPLQKLLDAYEKKKQYERNKVEWMKTEAGKEYNRNKAKEYYNRHKDEVLAKRASRYETDKDTLLTRSKEYYSLHSEECKQKNKERRIAKKGETKVEEVGA